VTIADGYDATPRELASFAPGGGTRRVAVGPYDVRIEVGADRGLTPGLVATVEGPGGAGTAWIAGEPTSLAMRFGGVAARIGDRPLLLRRSRPALRRRDRVIRIHGPSLKWQVRSSGRGAVIEDAATGGALWAGDRRSATLSRGLSPDEVALAVLLIQARVPDSTRTWAFLRFV
jgi:hypothetical protein